MPCEQSGSLYPSGIPVTTLIFERMGATLELAIVSVIIAILLGYL